MTTAIVIKKIYCAAEYEVRTVKGTYPDDTEATSLELGRVRADER